MLEKTTRYLMLKEEKMLKDKTSLSIKDTTKSTRDGMLSTLAMLKKKPLRDLIKISVFISTDHSTSDLECQCKELWKLSAQAMLP